MKFDFLVLLSFIAGLCSSQSSFNFSTDSLSITVIFGENDSASMKIENLAQDSIYIPIRNRTLPFSMDTVLNTIDTIVKECRIQIGLTSSGNCHTATAVKKLKSNEELELVIYIGNWKECSEIDFSFWLTYIKAARLVDGENIILVDEMEVGNCLYEHISDEASFYVSLTPKQ